MIELKIVSAMCTLNVEILLTGYFSLIKYSWVIFAYEILLSIRELYDLAKFIHAKSFSVSVTQNNTAKISTFNYKNGLNSETSLPQF